MPDFQPPMISMGSGFLISTDGWVITNAHVIEGADEVTIGLSDRREFTARVVGVDRPTDIALLKVEAINLPSTTLGNSNGLKVGQWVLAMGSPFGLERTATQGIISALGRTLPGDSYVPFIQTDAAVNPGNSGGPLFSLDGKVIGINSQIYSNSGGYMGVSFAIPINTAMEVVDQLKKNGRVERGWLGILIQDITPDLAKSFGLDRPRGALVSEVLQKGPAAKAGLQVGDVIVRFNTVAVQRSSELPPMVARTKPGTQITLTVVREGKEIKVPVRIEQLPDQPEQEAPPEPTPSSSRIGVQVAPLPDRLKGQVEGVLVTGVTGGAAARAGIQPGDVILRINNGKVGSVEAFEKIVAELPAGQPIPILVLRGGGTFFLSITLPDGE
jgi:serine protease Do